MGLETAVGDGWHLPTTDEIAELKLYMKNPADAGAQLKACDNTVGNWPSGWNGRDTYQLSVLPCGWFDPDYNIFRNLDTDAGIWTSTPTPTTLGPDSRYVWRFYNSRENYNLSGSNPAYGHSVRLVKYADNVTIGGRPYRTVTIGGKTWLAENLDLKFDGLTIGASGSSATQKRGNYYNNDETTYGRNGLKYGLLYNMAAVNYIEQNKSTLIPGWHVPTNAEWQALCDAVGGTSTAGTKLKAVSGWPEGEGGDGTTKFNALPSFYKYDNEFGYPDYPTSLYWTSNKYDDSNSYYWYINMYPDSGYSNLENKAQCSLRLVKDS